MSPRSPLPVPPELVDRDRLSDLLDFLRDNHAAEMAVDLSGRTRLPTQVLQVLAAASRDGVRLRVDGLTPSLGDTMRLLGLSGPIMGEGAP